MAYVLKHIKTTKTEGHTFFVYWRHYATNYAILGVILSVLNDSLLHDACEHYIACLKFARQIYFSIETILLDNFVEW